jgi:hypothetical protein
MNFLKIHIDEFLYAVLAFKLYLNLNKALNHCTLPRVQLHYAVLLIISTPPPAPGLPIPPAYLRTATDVTFRRAINDTDSLYA